MMGITRDEMLWWTEFLDLQILIFHRYVDQTGEPLVPLDPAAIGLLKANDPSVKKSVEAAIENCSKNGAWPTSLRRDVYVHLFYRAFNAHSWLIVVASVEEGAPGLIQLGSPAFVSPDPADKPRFIRWLFIDLWDAGAEDFIKRLAPAESRA